MGIMPYKYALISIPLILFLAAILTSCLGDPNVGIAVNQGYLNSTATAQAARQINTIASLTAIAAMSEHERALAARIEIESLATQEAGIAEQVSLQNHQTQVSSRITEQVLNTTATVIAQNSYRDQMEFQLDKAAYRDQGYYRATARAVEHRVEIDKEKSIGKIVRAFASSISILLYGLALVGLVILSAIGLYKAWIRIQQARIIVTPNGTVIEIRFMLPARVIDKPNSNRETVIDGQAVDVPRRSPVGATVNGWKQVATGQWVRDGEEDKQKFPNVNIGSLGKPDIIDEQAVDEWANGVIEFLLECQSINEDDNTLGVPHFSKFSTKNPEKWQEITDWLVERNLCHPKIERQATKLKFPASNIISMLETIEAAYIASPTLLDSKVVL